MWQDLGSETTRKKDLVYLEVWGEDTGEEGLVLLSQRRVVSAGPLGPVLAGPTEWDLSCLGRGVPLRAPVRWSVRLSTTVGLGAGQSS